MTRQTTAKRVATAKDGPVIGTGIPMVTADQVVTNFNDLVYTASLESRWMTGDVYTYAFNLQAHRVIQINYRNRYIRLRCERGCEQTVKFDGGCNLQKIYSSLDAAKQSLDTKLKTYIGKYNKELDETRGKISICKEALKELKTKKYSKTLPCLVVLEEVKRG